MAAISKSGTPSLSSLLTPQNGILNCVAAEDIAAGDVCYLSGVDANGQSQATRANGSAANAAARARGVAHEAAKSGEAVTLLRNGRMRWATGLVSSPGVGAPVYLGTSAGGLDTAATTGGTAPIGFVVNDTIIQFDFRP